MGMPQPGMPQGIAGGPGYPGIPNMAPQRMPSMTGSPLPQMPQNPIQTHDNGLLQMLLGPSMNGQNGQALGLLKMLAQMPHSTPPINPQGMLQPIPGGPPPFFSPQQAAALGQQAPQMPPNFGQFLNFLGQGQ